MKTQKRRLMWLGMLLFLLGLITGLLEQRFTNVRMGLSAHLEGVMNGILLLAAKRNGRNSRNVCFILPGIRWRRIVPVLFTAENLPSTEGAPPFSCAQGQTRWSLFAS